MITSIDINVLTSATFLQDENPKETKLRSNIAEYSIYNKLIVKIIVN